MMARPSPSPVDPLQQRANDLARRISAMEQEERDIAERIAQHKTWRNHYGAQDVEENLILAELEAAVPTLATLYYQVASRSHQQHKHIVTTKASEVARYLDIVAGELRLFAAGGQIESSVLDLDPFRETTEGGEA